MIEVYLAETALLEAEARLHDLAKRHNGCLTFKEAADELGPQKGTCLTFEFPSEGDAQAMVERVRGMNIHVEGPYDY